MEILILGTQCLYDIAKRDGNAAHQWYVRQELTGVHFGDICISAFSIAQVIMSFANNPPSTPNEKSLEFNLHSLINDFETADAVIGCSPAAARYWAEYLPAPVMYDNPPPPYAVGTEAIVIATVAAGHEGIPCRLVDRLQLIHQSLNLKVLDPHSGKMFP
jgi:hypothetical protein